MLLQKLMAEKQREEQDLEKVGKGNLKNQLN